MQNLALSPFAGEHQITEHGCVTDPGPMYRAKRTQIIGNKLVETAEPPKERPTRQGVGFSSWEPMTLAIIYQIKERKPRGRSVAYYMRRYFPELIEEKQRTQIPTVTDAAINARWWRGTHPKLNEKRHYKHLFDEAIAIIKERCGF